jgi:hypothetical protein
MAGYIQGGRVPRDASVGSTRRQGPSVSSSERVYDIRVDRVSTTAYENCVDYPTE